MATSKVMISIRKERNPKITTKTVANKRTPHIKHPTKVIVLSVARKAISETSVDLRPKPLSTLLSMTKMVKKRSLNSLNLTSQSHPVVPMTTSFTN